MENINIGFIGAGSIAKAHAYSISSLKYYYDDIPNLKLEAVTSMHENSRTLFASKYGFRRADKFNDFIENSEINAVFILGPNKVHFEHFENALNMKGVKYIYLEKPVCASIQEEVEMNKLLEHTSGIKIQVGFQYLQTSGLRSAMKLWKSGKLGKPVHFDLKYYHGDYLQPDYRSKRVSRLTPAPDGGAMADLGSHGISLLMAFMGNDIKIHSALQGGQFNDVSEGSDLFSTIALYDTNTGAVGNLSASRISSGSGDLVKFELYAEKGSLRYSSLHPEYFEYYLEGSNQWIKQVVGSDYLPASGFPSVHVSPGWLRALVHAHYLFFTHNDNESFIPDLKHGLAVQRIVRETAEHLKVFRDRR